MDAIALLGWLRAGANKPNGFLRLNADGAIPPELVDAGKIFAVTWTPGQDSPALTRARDAVGMRADVGTDVATVYHNDFDTIYPWARRRCCGDFNAKGEMVVNAYDGEDGFATDGSNGNVWIEEPVWYYMLDWTNGFIGISMTQHEGYLPSPRHERPDGTIIPVLYSPAYRLSLVNGKGASVSGQIPYGAGTTALNNACKAYNPGAHLESIRDRVAEWLLSVVEFATFNHKSIMYGAASMDYSSASSLVTANTADVNYCVVANATGAKYVVGQTLCIGTSRNGTNVISNRRITAVSDIEGDTENKRITFDGAPATFAVGDFLYSRCWFTGSCDSLLHPSGSPCGSASPSSASKYPCRYRYSEIAWGDCYSTLIDLMIQRVGSGTEEDPYGVKWNFLPDPADYDGTLNAAYVELEGSPVYTDGYVADLTFDSRFRFAFVVSAVGATGTTKLSAYHYIVSSNVVRSVRVGGSLNSGVRVSPLCFLYLYAVETSNLSFGGGLFVTQ